MFGYLGIGAAKTISEFRRKFWSVGITHDYGRHSGRPPKVISIEKVAQALDIVLAKAPAIVAIVEVTRRRAYQDEPVEEVRLADSGQTPDHRAHRMSHEQNVFQVQLGANFQEIRRISIQRPILCRVERFD